MKNSQKESKGRFEHTKESETLKTTSTIKSEWQRKKNAEKWTKPKGTVGGADQCTHHGDPKKKGGKWHRENIRIMS